MPQIRGQTTKTVTVKVTKSVVLTARELASRAFNRSTQFHSDRTDNVNDKAWQSIPE